MSGKKYEHDATHHSNHSHANKNQKKLLFSAIFIASFMFVEVAGGIISGSLALISDAGHMLSDFAALMMAFIAAYVSKKKPDDKRTYGYSRFPILIAYSNALFMLVVIGWISFHSISRFLNPVDIMTTPMIIVASIGFVVNVIVFFILHSGDKKEHDLNVKSAAIHVLGDLLGSVAAIVAAIVIMYTGWTPIDPLLSILIAVIILFHAIPVIKETAHILMQGSPEFLKEKDIQECLIEKIEHLNIVDHVHLWYQNDAQIMSTMHVQVDDCKHFETVKVDIRNLLINKFNIHHVTIELEKH